jgi:hypothetical protein
VPLRLQRAPGSWRSLVIPVKIPPTKELFGKLASGSRTRDGGAGDQLAGVPMLRALLRRKTAQARVGLIRKPHDAP